MAGRSGARTRTAVGNRPLVGLVAAHLLAVAAEYASIVGVLVYAFEHGGPRTTGLASLAILLPTLVGAPIAAALTGNVRPQLVRQLGLALQAGGYGGSALAAAADLPVAVVVGFVVVALAAVTTLRPTGAVLLPAIVRSTGELTIGNLWIAYCEAASALVGPVAAAVLLSGGGPVAVLAGCAGSAAAATVLSLFSPDRGPPAASDETGWQPGRGLSAAVGLVRRRPGALGVMGVALARYIVLGALDVLLVVLAYDALDLRRSGAGVLNALVGAGAVASTVVATAVVRRARLAPWLAVGLLAAAVLCAVLAAETSWRVAVVVLPLVGLAVSLVDGLGRMLLQRSADPRLLGSLFALVEFVSGVGLLAGSALAQLLIAVADVRVALYGLAATLVVVLLATARSVLQADAHADLPVVEMSLLRALPMFAPSSPLTLEAVARSAESVPVTAGEVLITEGDVGDRFYAVSSGEFDVTMGGTHVRVARRGSFFGEVALLADVPRTGTVTALGDGELLAVDRVPFLIAVTGSDTSRAAAWGVVRARGLDIELPPDLDD